MAANRVKMEDNWPSKHTFTCHIHSSHEKKVKSWKLSLCSLINHSSVGWDWIHWPSFTLSSARTSAGTANTYTEPHTSLLEKIDLVAKDWAAAGQCILMWAVKLITVCFRFVGQSINQWDGFLPHDGFLPSIQQHDWHQFTSLWLRLIRYEPSRFLFG